MNNLKQALILHTRPYRDTSLLIDFFTQDHGRISAIARGAKRPKSSWRGILQAFTPLLINYTGRHELQTLTVAEADSAAIKLTGNHLLSALYLNELLIKLLERQDPHPDLYHLYRMSLEKLAEDSSAKNTYSQQLDFERGANRESAGVYIPVNEDAHEICNKAENSSATSIEPILRKFELKLLQELGYGLSLDQTTNRQPIYADAYYNFNIESGIILLPALVNANRNSALSGASLLAMTKQDFSDADVLRDAKRLCRTVINILLGNKTLHSRQLFMKSF